MFQNGKIEIFNHGNILEGHSSVVWDPNKKNKIIQHFESQKPPQNLLVRNFEIEVESVQNLLCIPNLKGLISLDDMNRADGINGFTELEIFICLSKINVNIDLNKLKKLKILSIIASNLNNFDLAENLEILHIEKVKADFDVSNNLNLRELSFQNGTLKNFICIKHSKKLKKLVARDVSSLESLEGLSNLHSKLEYLEIFNANKLTKLKNLRYLENIKTLYLQRIPDVSNLEFLVGLNKLEKLVLGCKVEKVEYKYIKHIKYVFIPGYEGNTME